MFPNSALPLSGGRRNEPYPLCVEKSLAFICVHPRSSAVPNLPRPNSHPICLPIRLPKPPDTLTKHPVFPARRRAVATPAKILNPLLRYFSAPIPASLGGKNTRISREFCIPLRRTASLSGGSLLHRAARLWYLLHPFPYRAFRRAAQFAKRSVGPAEVRNHPGQNTKRVPQATIPA